MTKPTKRLRPDGAEAFLPDPEDGPIVAEANDDDVEAFAEEFIASVTGADDVQEEARNEETDDEIDSLRAGSWINAPEPLDDELRSPDL